MTTNSCHPNPSLTPFLLQRKRGQKQREGHLQKPLHQILLIIPRTKKERKKKAACMHSMTRVYVKKRKKKKKALPRHAYALAPKDRPSFYFVSVYYQCLSVRSAVTPHATNMDMGCVSDFHCHGKPGSQPAARFCHIFCPSVIRFDSAGLSSKGGEGRIDLPRPGVRFLAEVRLASS